MPSRFGSRPVAIAVVVAVVIAVVGVAYVAAPSNAPPGDGSGPSVGDGPDGSSTVTDGAAGTSSDSTGSNSGESADGSGDSTGTDGGDGTPTDGEDGLAPMASEFSIAESPEVQSVSASDLDRSTVTVVATQGYYPEDEVADLVAFTNEGKVIYHEANYGVYFDVDPVPGTKFTVEYLASKHLNGTECESVPADKCTRDVIRQVNLTTGESETVYAEVTTRIYGSRQHDADRINDTHVVVGDIVEDRVFILNTTSEEIVWQWNASYDYAKDSGGKWYDWTHLNDVEVLPDGRIMASLRNQDQVVFLDPSKPGREALQENWTIGEDDNTTILHKQHNPDYIPEERGGPAVLIGDSENDRVVEYQRVDGDWERTWTYSENLSWPRDADRLPNGNTAIVSTRNDLVVGVGPNDEVVWRVHIGMPYDVERLGSGDESAGGMVASQRNTTDSQSLVAAGGRAGGGQSVPPVDVARSDAWTDLGAGLAAVSLLGALAVLLAWAGGLGARRLVGRAAR